MGEKRERPTTTAASPFTGSDIPSVISIRSVFYENIFFECACVKWMDCARMSCFYWAMGVCLCVCVCVCVMGFRQTDCEATTSGQNVKEVWRKEGGRLVGRPSHDYDTVASSTQSKHCRLHNNNLSKLLPLSLSPLCIIQFNTNSNACSKNWNKGGEGVAVDCLCLCLCKFV